MKKREETDLRPLLSGQINRLRDNPPKPVNIVEQIEITITDPNPRDWKCTFSNNSYQLKGRGTPIDIDVGSTLPANDGDYVEIVLTIKRNEKMKFMEDRLAVTTGGKGEDVLFKLAYLENDKNGDWTKVSFLCKLVRGVAGNLDPIPYNIGIIITDGKDLEFPIFYDPKVQNGG